jgi:hypothetical protein
MITWPGVLAVRVSLLVFALYVIVTGQAEGVAVANNPTA